MKQYHMTAELLMYSAQKELFNMSNSVKRLIGTIYLKDEKVFSSLDLAEEISKDPAIFASDLSDSGVDEILVYDLSTPGSDVEHEKALDVIKLICKASDVPVIGTGNIKRMEDVKKLLYAGCKKAALDFRSSRNADIIQEVSEKFGRDKILVLYEDDSDINDNSDAVSNYASELILFTKDISAITDPEICMDTVIMCDQDADYKTIAGIFEKGDRISAVCGRLVNICSKNIDDIKRELTDKGFKISALEPRFTWENLKKNSDGMVPVIVQDYRTDQVLMLAYMNEEAYNTTLRTGKMTYFSRSRNELWIKGETSSHYQYVKSLTADCDLDTILAKVKQVGAACHTGSYSCFFNEIASKEYTEKNPQKVLDSVFEVIKDRKINPREGSYTNYLFDKGIDKILKKVGEEATEMVIAAKNPNENEIVYEMSDFLYHMMVLMAQKNVSWEDITDELSRR